jgi:hypothetical protein
MMPNRKLTTGNAPDYGLAACIRATCPGQKTMLNEKLNVARMERSAIRETRGNFPDSGRGLHPGYTRSAR